MPTTPAPSKTPNTVTPGKKQKQLTAEEWMEMAAKQTDPKKKAGCFSKAKAAMELQHEALMKKADEGKLEPKNTEFEKAMEEVKKVEHTPAKFKTDMENKNLANIMAHIKHKAEQDKGAITEKGKRHKMATPAADLEGDAKDGTPCLRHAARAAILWTPLSEAHPSCDITEMENFKVVQYGKTIDTFKNNYVAKLLQLYACGPSCRLGRGKNSQRKSLYTVGIAKEGGNETWSPKHAQKVGLSLLCSYHNKNSLAQLSWNIVIVVVFCKRSPVVRKHPCLQFTQ